MFDAFKVENNSIKKNHWVLRSTERDIKKSIKHSVKKNGLTLKGILLSDSQNQFCELVISNPTSPHELGRV